MLLNCNALSHGRLKAANDDFKKHIKLINEMKKDLDYIFKKIRNIKSRIGAQYPQAMKKVEQKIKVNSLTEDVSEEEIASITMKPDTNLLQKELAGTSCKNHDKKLSKDDVTVNYVQMETSTDKCDTATSDGKALDESTDTSTDSDT